MKIIVLGAGKVGKTLIKHMSNEDHDIIVVDQNATKVEEVVNQYDVIGVVGNGGSYDILMEAGAEDANLIICVTTSDDPQARLTVMDLVKGACAERIYPVGRLDRNTTGVLLLTNDGDLASKLTHPKYLKKKIYHVYLDKNLTKADMDQIAAGIQLEDGEIHADAISYSDEVKRDQVGIEIHSGKNRIVRRIFESLGYKVVKLDRVFFAGLTKKGLRRGEWRYLTEQEVNFLRMGSFE